MISIFIHSISLILFTFSGMAIVTGYLIARQIRRRPETAIFWVGVLRRLLEG